MQTGYILNRELQGSKVAVGPASFPWSDAALKNRGGADPG